VFAPRAKALPYRERGLSGTVRARSLSVSALLPAIRAALEAAGVEFTNGDEPGVKLRKAKSRG
jgi:hypothetical protein